ncbi:30.6 kDa protein in fumA 3'region [Seiridium cupressi]
MNTLLTLLVLLVLLLIPFYIIYKPPRPLIRYFARRWPDVLWEIDTKTKVVALTIDDAPSEYTEQILGVLKAYDATATFFTIGGQVSGREEILADIVRSGNELGNHAMHDEPSRALSDDELTAQIETVRDKIRAAYKTAEKELPPQYFRPGSGFFSDRMRRLVNKLGYRLVLGTATKDIGHGRYDPVNQYKKKSEQHGNHIVDEETTESRDTKRTRSSTSTRGKVESKLRRNLRLVVGPPVR